MKLASPECEDGASVAMAFLGHRVFPARFFFQKFLVPFAVLKGFFDGQIFIF
jgi:hypothetical protein